jgi:ketosteroid isomerase-like protein
MTTAEMQDVRAFAEHFATGWRAGGPADRFVEHFAAVMSPDVVLIQPLARTVRGQRGMRGVFAPIFAAIPDLRGEVQRWGETEDGLLIELTLRGTLDGRPIEWTVCDRIVLREGLMVERRSYFDPLPLMRAVVSRPRAGLRLLRQLNKREERR